MAAQLLRGIPIDAAGHNASVRILERSAIKLANHSIPEVAEVLYVSYDHDALTSMEPLSSEVAKSDCLGLVASQWGQDFRAAEACGALAAALNVIWEGPYLEFTETLRGYDEDAHRIVVSNLTKTVPGASYTLTGTLQGLFTRFLSVAPSSEAQLDIELTPSGHVMGGTLKRSRLAPSGSSFLLKQDVLTFDHRIRLTKSESEQHVPLEAFRRVVRSWLASRAAGNMPRHLPTDGSNPLLHQPVRAMLLENGLDWQAEDLMQRLDLDHQAAESFSATGQFLKPLFFAPLLDLTTSAAEFAEGRHGTVVASLMAADLPGLTLALMNISAPWWTHPDSAASVLDAKIEHHRASVVNISQDFSSALTDCEAFFGPTFSKFEAEVLFVASAGNSGMRNFTGTCPASLARSHPNVVSVGGLRPDGTLGDKHGRKQAGNFGAETVDIAAPMDVHVPYERLGQITTEFFSGTSFSAASVSNAALRILARRPDLKPHEVKAILLGTCDQRWLDVACGGALDVEAIEAWLARHPQAPARH